ncbi:MAG: glycerophosphodiester phosphodiesterase [Actinobacteria bacterium]|nr:glycerophosphodiester phosphodiesterase [Actinomycetota bacterium]
MRTRALIVLALAVASVAPAARASGSTTIYAHRGGAGLAPENTLGAFRQAEQRFGARGVWLEMDVQLDAEGELVVIHDPTLDRTTTNCTGNVSAHTTAQLQQCDARKTFPAWPVFEPVPRFTDVLREATGGGWLLFPEIKNIPGEDDFDPTGIAAASVLVADVRASGIDPAHVVVQSFFPTSLDYLEVHAPDIATSLLTTSQLPGAPPSVGFNVTENVAYAKARGYEQAEPDDASPDLGPQTIAAAHALGVPVAVWTVDDPVRIAGLAAAGVDGIVTNRPDLAFEALG